MTEKSRVLGSRYLIALLLASPLACLASEAYACPERIHLEAATVANKDVPAGSQALVGTTPLLLTGAGLFDGPPEQGAALKPRSIKANASLWRIDWQAEQGIWLACDYDNGLAHVYTRAPDGINQCQASWRKDGKPSVLKIQISCQ